ncbi:DNA cytosine methyltransferase [Variovorax boronicumulans]|uniref:DNA cytosine methyltransferase n=1 Tax=Variovorax boronicumulans TaxID=436515 RepID=UPI00351FC1C7
MEGALNELALFAGAGGGILANELCGDRTVCAVERDAYAAAILAQRQNDGTLPVFPIWSDVCTFDGRPWRGIVDVISGGFPCQDISASGTAAGIEGSRSGLWKQMGRIIGEIRPRFVRVENSPLLVGRGLAVVLGDLAALGFDARWGCLSAAALGAPHERNRAWVVGRNIADTFGLDGERLLGESIDSCKRSFAPSQSPRLLGGAHWQEWPAEPRVCRVGHGLAYRVDRCRALGNGQVPRVAAAAWHLLASGAD